MAPAGAGAEDGLAALLFGLLRDAGVLVEPEDGGALAEGGFLGGLDVFEGFVGVDGGGCFAAGCAGMKRGRCCNWGKELV